MNEQTLANESAHDDGETGRENQQVEIEPGLSLQRLQQQNQTLEELVAQRTVELQTLFDLSQQMAYNLDPKQLLQLVLGYIQRVVPYDLAAGLLVGSDKNRLVVQPACRLAPSLEDDVQELIVSSYSRMSGNHLEIESVEVDFCLVDLPAAAAEPVNSLAARFNVPIVVGEGGLQTVGLIFVAREQDRAFSQDEIRFLHIATNQAAGAIQRLQALLEQRWGRLESVLEHLPEGMLLLSADGRIRLANPAAREYLLVLGKADTVNNCSDAFQHGPATGQVLTSLGGQALSDLLAPPPTGLWHSLETPSGSYECIARQVKATSGDLDWLLVIRDVTREREVQHRIRQQERLAAVGQLAAGIAHDFNNIMAVIGLYTQLALQSSDLLPKTRERLKIIDRQSHQATDLIQQILDFSRRSRLERRPMNLEPFLKEQVKLLKRTVPENIKIRFIYGVEEPLVNADPTRIQQIVMNLAVNARDAMPDGGELRIGVDRIVLQAGEQPPLPEMVLDVTPSESGEGGTPQLITEWVKLTVSDSGSGISQEVLPHIFEPFFTTKGSHEGSGLGLAQVYGIVRQHEGYIDVQTRLGQGTIFNIYLPALPILWHDSSIGQEPELVQGAGQTVLVVEDNPSTRQALAVCLRDLNYFVLEAANGREALSVYDQHRDEIALVLSDMVMPEMGGKALLQALREQDPAVKLIAVSGYLLRDEIESLEMDGVVGWLQKPVPLSELARVVAETLAV